MNKRVFAIIDKIANEHCHKVFGYLSKNDLKNEIWVICLEKLPEFKKKRGELEHFLRSIVKNRLINRFKDITKSVRSPCPRCKYYDPGKSPGDCAKFGTDKHLCKKWKNYLLSVKSRNSLLNSTDAQFERSYNDSSVNLLIVNELKEIILKKLPKEFLMDFNLLISGSRIQKHKLKKLKKEIVKIVDEHNSRNKVTTLTVNGKVIENGKE